MVAIGFIVEHAILGTWSLILFVLYFTQLRQDISIERIVNMQTGESNSSIIFKNTKSLGYTAYVFHLGGTIGCLILIVRSIDPFPVLGVLPFVATDLLSHLGIAVLLNTLFEGMGSMASKMYYKLNLPVGGNFLQWWIRLISYLTVMVAMITWAVENFVSNILMYSAGVYFIYGTCIQWIILLIYNRMIRVFQGQFGSGSQFLNDSSAAKSMKKLGWIRSMFLGINIFLTIYQIYIFINQVRSRETRESLKMNPNQYHPVSAPLYLIQILGYSLLLWFCYIPSNKIGNKAVGLSETSMTNISKKVAIRQMHAPEVQEVVVKFKNHEAMHPAINNEDPQHTTIAINRQGSIDSHESQIDAEGRMLPPIYNSYRSYPSDTVNSTAISETSTDIVEPIHPDELRRLMRLIEQQAQAEKEGRLDEFIKQQESSNLRGTFTSDQQYLHNQIQAMKEREYYERMRFNRANNFRDNNFRADNLSAGLSPNNSAPPSIPHSANNSAPPSAPPSPPQNTADRSFRRLFVVPDDEAGYLSSSSDLNTALGKSRKVKK